MKPITEDAAFVAGVGEDNDDWGDDPWKDDDDQDDFSVSVYNAKAPVGNSRPKAVPIARIHIGGGGGGGGGFNGNGSTTKFNGNAPASNVTIRVKSKAAAQTFDDDPFGVDKDPSYCGNNDSFSKLEGSFSNLNGSFSLDGFPRAAVTSPPPSSSAGGQGRSSRNLSNKSNISDHGGDRGRSIRGDRSIASSRRARSMERPTRGKSVERPHSPSKAGEESKSARNQLRQMRRERSQSPGKFRGNKPERAERKERRERSGRSQSPGKFRGSRPDRSERKRTQSPGKYQNRNRDRDPRAAPRRAKSSDDVLGFSSHHESSADEALGGSGGRTYRSKSPGRLSGGAVVRSSDIKEIRQAMEGRPRRTKSSDDVLGVSAHSSYGESSADEGLDGGRSYRSTSPGRLSGTGARRRATEGRSGPRRMKSRDNDPLGASSHHTESSADEGLDGGRSHRSTSPGRLSGTGSRRRATEGRSSRRRKSNDSDPLGASSHHTESSADDGLAYKSRSSSPGRLSNTGSRRRATDDRRRTVPRRTKSEDVSGLAESANKDVGGADDSADDGFGRSRRRGVTRSKSMDLPHDDSDTEQSESTGEIELRAVNKILNKLKIHPDNKQRAALGSALKFVDDQAGSSRKSQRPGDDRSYKSEGLANRHAGEAPSRRMRKGSRSFASNDPLNSLLNSSSSSGMALMDEIDKAIEEEGENKSNETINLVQEQTRLEEVRLRRLKEEARVLEEKRLNEEARLNALKEEADQLELAREQRLAEKDRMVARLREEASTADVESRSDSNDGEQHANNTTSSAVSSDDPPAPLIRKASRSKKFGSAALSDNAQLPPAFQMINKSKK